MKKIGGFFKKHFKLIIAIAIIIAIVFYLRTRAMNAAQTALDAATQPVTATIELMDLQQSVSVTGTLNAIDKKTVTSTIGGTGVTGIKVSKVNFKEGDYVEAGDVVVEFDGDDYNRKIAELNAQYSIDDTESAQSIQNLQKQIEETQLKVESTQKQISDDQEWLAEREKYYINLKDAYEAYKKYPYAEDTYKRYQSESEICSTMYGLTITGYEAKQDEVKTLQDSLTTYQNTIENYQSQIELAQMKLNYAQTYTRTDAKDDVYESMEKTQVTSPISGYIITMNVEEGNNYTQGNTVFTIADTSGFDVEATVNEYDIANIKQDLPAVIKFEATGSEEFDGQVTFVSIASESTVSSSSSSSSTYSVSSSSSTSSGTATYKIKIKLNENDDRLRVGMTAKASVVLASVSNVLAVPYDCVQQNEDDGTYFITVISDDGTTTNITVEKGLESDYYVEIKGDGIEEGMTVEAVVSDAPSTNVMDYMYFE